MIRMVGKYLCEAVCPICDSIYLLDEQSADVEFNSEDKDTIDRVIFYCSDCQRRVRAQDYSMKKVSTGYLKHNFYNMEEDP